MTHHEPNEHINERHKDGASRNVRLSVTGEVECVLVPSSPPFFLFWVFSINPLVYRWYRG